MDAIFARRSVRKYTNEAIADEILEQLLRAAMRAPSAGNEQPWHFVVIRDREQMKQIQSWHPYATALSTANVVVAVCADKNLLLYEEGYWIQDCSAAMENLLIEATNLGIGSVWMGIYPIEDRVTALRETLELPDYVMPLGLAALGYPEKEKLVSDTYKPERIHSERW